MRRRGAPCVGALALAALAMLGACGDDVARPAATAPPAAPDASRIVLALPLSGPLAALGTSAASAARAVLRDAAARDDGAAVPALELVDVGAGRCGTAAEAAAADARTVALVGGLDEACADALGRLAAASGLAFATGAPGAVPARTGSVRTTAGSSDGGVAAATLAGDLGATRIAILEDGGRGEDAVGDAVARAAEEEGIAVAQRVLVAPGTANDVVLGLGDVDAIVLLAPPAPAGLAVLAARGALAAPPPVIATDAYATAAVAALPAPQLAGLRVLFPGVAPPVVLGRGGAAGRLAEELAAEDASLEPLAAETAAAVQAVLAALAVGPPTRRGVRAAIAGIRVDAGASATGAVLAFAADGSAAVRAFSVLVARPPRLDVERTLVLP